MRLIGNKKKLVAEIDDVLARRGIVGGTLIDIFAGTSSVGCHFKRRGFRVVSNDLMSSCYAQAVARVEVSRCPAFRDFRARNAELLASPGFRDGLVEQGDLFAGRDSAEGAALARRRRPLVETVRFLNTAVQPYDGLVFRSFCPGGLHGRRYFTDDNGRKIDGILRLLRNHFRDGTFSRAEFYLLLKSLLDAADRVANISGTYGAFLKSWQASAMRRLDLAVPEIVESGQRNRAYCEDGNRLVRRVKGDVLYIDPPYNQRQYAANYHVLEVLARYHETEDLEAFEGSLYGKTGLIPYDAKKSDYCVRSSARRRRARAGAGDVLSAMSDLVLSTKAKHVVVSYNEEGLLGRDEIGGILARFSGKKAFDYRRDFRAVVHKRFRSDRDRSSRDRHGRRKYKVLPGRSRDQISEWLFFASRSGERGAGDS